MKNVYDYCVKHLPVIIGLVLVAVNYLIDTNSITLSAHTIGLVNALLAAAGLGSLHYKQIQK